MKLRAPPKTEAFKFVTRDLEEITDGAVFALTASDEVRRHGCITLGAATTAEALHVEQLLRVSVTLRA